MFTVSIFESAEDIFPPLNYLSTMNDRCTQHHNELLELQTPEQWHADIKSTLTRALATPDTNLTHEERVSQNDRLITLMCSCCKYNSSTKE